MTVRRPLARALAVVFLVLAILPVGGGVAAAHGGGIGPEAHVPEIVALDPPVPGLDVAVIEAGERLRIDNRTGALVEVIPPPGTARTVEPVVAAGATERWTDTRVTAAAVDPPPTDGRRAWVVPLDVGGQPVLIRGEQVWPTPPPAAAWWLTTAIVAVAVAVVGILAVRRPRWSPVLAAITVLVSSAHLVHVLGSALVVEGRPYAAVALGAAGLGMVAWPLGFVGAALTLARRSYGPLLCALSGAILALVTAFDATGFSSAVLPFGWAADLDRATTVLTFGGGIGLFLTGFAALDRLTDRERTETVVDR